MAKNTLNGGDDLFGWQGKSLKQATKEYWSHIRDGAHCECCERDGREYRRALNSGMAWWLILFFRHCQANGVNGAYVDVRTVEGGIEKAHKCEFEKLVYWGLIERDPAPREEGHASGFWRMTPLGRDFVLRKITVPSHAIDYNGGCRGLEGTGISIITALRKKFDYDELMDGW